MPVGCLCVFSREMSSLEKYLFSSSAHQVVYFLVLICMSFLYMLDINPLLIIPVAHIFFFLFLSFYYRVL